MNHGIKLSRRELQEEVERTQRALAQLSHGVIADLDAMRAHLAATREFMTGLSERIDEIAKENGTLSPSGSDADRVEGIPV